MARKLILFLVVVCLIAGVLPAVAQEDNLIATDLLAPRGVAYDEAGNLWVAEAGNGGDILLSEDGPFGPVSLGYSSRVTMIAPDGTQTAVLSGFGSLNAGGAIGIVRAVPHGENLYVLTGEGAPNNPLADVLLILDVETLRVKHVVDLYAYEQANNTDGTEEVYSNASDVEILEDGTVYILDTGANVVLQWKEGEGLSPFLVWNNNPVPTALDVAPDGTVWVAFLGQAIAPNAARVEQWTADGSEMLAEYTGMTALTDIFIDAEGSVYVVSMAQFEEGEVPIPNSGAVLKLTDGAFAPIAEGLSFPFGIAQAADGSFAVSINTIAMAPEMVGGVVRIEAGQ